VRRAPSRCAGCPTGVWLAVVTVALGRCVLRQRVRLAVAALLALLTAPAAAQVTLSIDPAMATGPAQAPVVIVEFSDYQ